MDDITIILSEPVPFHVQAVFVHDVLKLWPIAKAPFIALRDHPAFFAWLRREGHRFIDPTSKEREWLDRVEKESHNGR